MSQKRSHDFNLVYKPLRGFDRSMLTDSPLLPVFRDQINELLTHTERLKGIFLAFTNLIFISAAVLIVILLVCLYFTFYTLIGVWLIMIAALCFSNYQVRLRVRVALSTSELFEDFISKTGDLFLINVKLGKQKDTFFRLKRYYLMVNISCFDQAIMAEEDKLDVVVCGGSEKVRRNSFSHNKKKNKVHNVYKLNNKKVVDYGVHDKRDSVMSGKLSKDSIKRYVKVRNSEFKKKGQNGCFFDRLEDVMKDDFVSYSENKPSTVGTLNDFKSNFSDTKVTCGERRSVRKMDSVNLNSRFEASFSNKENIKSMFHNKHEHTTSTPFIRRLTEKVEKLDAEMKGLLTDRR